MPKIRGDIRKGDGTLRRSKLNVVKNRDEKGVMIFIGGQHIILNEYYSLKLANLLVDQCENWVPYDDGNVSRETP